MKTVRIINTVRDNVSLNNGTATITSGSFGEGLQMRGSDTDIMHVYACTEVHANMKSATTIPTKTHFLMMTEDTKPGFTMLRLIDINNISLISIDKNLFLPNLGLVKLELTYYTQSYSPTLLSCRKFRGQQYLSNILFKQLLSIEGMSEVHGPCLTDLLCAVSSMSALFYSRK